MDDDADGPVGGSGPPLPPDDRLWRHPSELGTAAVREPDTRASAIIRRPAVWPVAVAAGLIGAALSGSLVAATATFDRTTESPAIEKVAVTPVVSSPMVAGDRGVPALAERLSPTIVRVMVRSVGDDLRVVSGVIFRTDGLVLTSATEVAGSGSLEVELHDGGRHEAELVGFDRPTDVAVLRIDADGLPVAVLGSSADLEPGTPTVAFGCPHSADEGPRLTTGVISSLGRRVEADGSALHGMIQTDAPIEAAAAGGPLVDATGAVIGITTAASDATAGFGYATPIDLVSRVAHQLLATGRAVHSWIGIEGADLAMERAEDMGIKGGAMVRDVADGSPADAGGLAPGDVIIEVAGEPVASSSDLVVALRSHAVGDKVRVGYWRAGAAGEVEVTLGERPGP